MISVLATVIGLAVANIALGFAAAVALRRQARRWGGFSAHSSASQPAAGPVAGPVPDASPGAEAGAIPNPMAAEAASADLAAILGRAPAVGQPPGQTETAGNVLPGAAPAIPAAAARQPPLPADCALSYGGTSDPSGGPPEPLQYGARTVAEAPEPLSIPPSQVEEGRPASDWQASVQALQRSSLQYQAQLAAVDEHLRTLRPEDTQEVLAAAASIRDAGKQYLCKQKQASPQVLSQAIPQDELAALALQIQAALDAQTAQIEASDRALATLEAATPEQLHGQCLAESTKLREANGRVASVLESALACLSAGGELSPVRAADEEPLPGGLIARSALEQKIAQWWHEDPGRKRPLALAVLEVDLFDQVSGRFGREVATRLLRAVTGIVLAEGGGHAVTARSTGPRFAMAFPDADVRLAIHVVERIRQAIERAQFRCHEFDLRVTLSAGITPAASDDNLELLWQRAETALGEARRYGRSRVFVHEGRYPTPVVPPNLDLPEKSIDL